MSKESENTENGSSDEEENYRMSGLKECGFDNKTCRRCESDGKPVLEAGGGNAVIYLCPECLHLWGVNHDEKKIEEIPKELEHYEVIVEKIKEEYKDFF
ncbi:MAG: hypothetical protein BTN85_0387 [Candidatus Methanohalarchaeum thermophilum]|uniref:Zn finger protein n=1 Tax=Methanohalarchaeum thermophilum TaxID=1903181 RepID=A0A1Q6DU61_METT1|nr:MAG: hypothetical protein BTN85_0387 [Candidatus Methanohalarchaeum thermophilum]